AEAERRSDPRNDVPVLRWPRDDPRGICATVRHLLVPAVMPSLLRQLGGRDALEIVVAGLYERFLTDQRLSRFFDDRSRARLELKLVEYLCALLGDSPGGWRGRDMAAAHHGLGIQDVDFDAFLTILSSTLQAAGVGTDLARAVRRRIESLRAAVVEVPGS